MADWLSVRYVMTISSFLVLTVGRGATGSPVLFSCVACTFE